MPVDREVWTRSFREAESPEGWHCPTCTGGYLHLLKESMHSDEGADTRWAHNEEWFDPEHSQLRFISLLQCSNQKCLEVVTVAGRGTYQQEMNEDQRDWSWQPTFDPLYINPPVRFIRIPDSAPNDVSDQLRLSFALLWASPSAAANHVRIAIENLMDALRIPRARRTKGVRMAAMTLHQRIDQLRVRDSDLANALFAIKWVGNAGSHLGELTRNDVFDAYDILEGVLDDLYVKNREATRRLIRDINRRKGPRPKRRTPSLL